MAGPGLPVHRVAAVVWLDMPAHDYGEAASHVDTALDRWLSITVGSREVPLWWSSGQRAGTARIVGVNTLNHVLTSGRLVLAPPLWETPTRVREAADRLDREETNRAD